MRDVLQCAMKPRRQAALCAAVTVQLAAACLLGAGTAIATEQVDQSFTSGLSAPGLVGPDGASTFQFIGQVFTAGITGSLTRIDLYVSYIGLPTSPIDFALSASDPTTGIPVGPVLANASKLSDNQTGGTVPLETSSLPTPTRIVFPSPANVTAGNRYVVFASTNQVFVASPLSAYTLWLNRLSSYPGGNAVWLTETGWNFSPSVNAGFTTYVNASNEGATTANRAPSDILQQVPTPAGGCASVGQADLNWSGVDAGGWSQSWAAWGNGGQGGAICTDTSLRTKYRWLGHSVGPIGLPSRPQDTSDSKSRARSLQD